MHTIQFLSSISVSCLSASSEMHSVHMSLNGSFYYCVNGILSRLEVSMKDPHGMSDSLVKKTAELSPNITNNQAI